MIKWIKKNYERCVKNDDVSITRQINRGNPWTAFRFRNGCEKRITGTGYIQPGISDGRVYFIASDEKNGYKLTGSQGSSNREFKCKGDYVSYTGDYDLMFDAKENLWFVDVSKNKIPQGKPRP